MRKLLILLAVLSPSLGLAQTFTYTAQETANTFINTNQFKLGIIPGPVVFGALGSPTLPTIIYCSDCTLPSTPCVGGGTGALAVYTGTQWLCSLGGGGGGGGSGTVTSVSVGNLSPLFTASVVNPTTAPSVSFTLSNAAGNTAFANCTGSLAAPSFCSLTKAMQVATTVYTDQSNTFTTGTQDFSGITLFKARFSAGLTTSVNGDFGFDSTNGNWHFWDGSDLIVPPVAAGFTSGHCPQLSIVSGKWTWADSGAACGAAGTVTGSGTAGLVPVWTGTGTSLGNTDLSYTTGTNNVYLSTSQWQIEPNSLTSGGGGSTTGIVLNPSFTITGSGTVTATGISIQDIDQSNNAAGGISSQIGITATIGAATHAETGTFGSMHGFELIVNPSGINNTTTVLGEYVQMGVAGNAIGATIATEKALDIKNIPGTLNTITNDYMIYLESPVISGAAFTHHYGLYIADQTPAGTGANSDPWGIFEAGTAKNQLGGLLTLGNGLTLLTVTGSTQCLQVNTSGVVSGFGAGCGTGLSGLTTDGVLYATSATTATTAAPPTVNGLYQWVSNVTASAAVVPQALLGGVPVTTPATPYAMLYSDRATYARLTGGSTFTWNLGQITGDFAANLPFIVNNGNSGLLTLTANAADKIDNSATGGTSTVLSNFLVHVFQDSSSAPGNWWTAKVPTDKAFPSCGDSSGNHLNFTAASGFICGTTSSGGSPALSAVTGSAAQATGTEVATGDEYTFAGIETANLTYPFTIQNTSALNNTSGALIVTTKGGGASQIPLVVNEATVAGNLQEWHTGDTVTNGVITVGTRQATLANTGALTLGVATCVTFGTAGTICPAEGTAPTNVSGAAPLYPDSTAHEFKVATNGSANFGQLVRSQPLPISLTSQTAAITNGTALCAASAGACNVAGMYRATAYFDSTVTCATPGPGAIGWNLTFTDETGTKTAQTVPLDVNGGTSLTSTMALGNTTNNATGTTTFWSTGASAIGYGVTYTACTTGTGTFAARIVVERVF